MPVSVNTRLFFVSSNGKVTPVVSTADEVNGSVTVRFADGHTETLGTFNLFLTDMAAQRAAAQRSIPKISEQFKFIRRNGS